MAYERYNRPITDIFGDLMRQASLLVRKEGQLARTEISEKIGEATTGIVLLVAGGVVIIPALVILLGAAVTTLADGGWSVAAAAMIVGGATLIIGIVLLAIGANKLSARELMPTRTLRQVQNIGNLASASSRADP